MYMYVYLLFLYELEQLKPNKITMMRTVNWLITLTTKCSYVAKRFLTRLLNEDAAHAKIVDEIRMVLVFVVHTQG